ncbi:hypothetical protein RJ639_020314 [Escallonia herrerae]|uniref:Uncharacterized protein n=1 Tax=Escallonia herrerae TaxID=1293975 RepID=A0AA89AGS8_9ASTE|nr:hypothetical protein RJ639_020314 [Escallonia herrerae]
MRVGIEETKQDAVMCKGAIVGGAVATPSQGWTRRSLKSSEAREMPRRSTTSYGTWSDILRIQAMAEDVQPLLTEVRDSGLLKEVESLTKSLTEATEDLRRVHSSIMTPENTELIQKSIYTLIFTLKNIEASEEQDNSDQGESEDESTTQPKHQDLAGVKVLHGLDKVMEGGAVVLTLKDQSILADGDINQEVDRLENMEIGEQKQKDEVYKAEKKKTRKPIGQLIIICDYLVYPLPMNSTSNSRVESGGIMHEPTPLRSTGKKSLTGITVQQKKIQKESSMSVISGYTSKHRRNSIAAQNTLIPTLDNLTNAYAECERLSAIVAAVKHCTVLQFPYVMCLLICPLTASGPYPTTLSQKARPEGVAVSSHGGAASAAAAAASVRHGCASKSRRPRHKPKPTASLLLNEVEFSFSWGGVDLE